MANQQAVVSDIIAKLSSETFAASIEATYAKSVIDKVINSLDDVTATFSNIRTCIGEY